MIIGNLELPEFGFAPLWVALASLVPACINICLCVYVGAALPRTKINLTFIQFLVFLIIWQIVESLSRTSETLEAAAFFAGLAIYPIIAVPVLGSKFVLMLSKRVRILNSPWYFVLYFVLPVLLAIFLTARGYAFKITPSDVFNWTINPQTNFITTLYSFWIAATALMMVYLSWYAYFKSPKDDHQRQHFLLLALGFSAPVILGVVFELFLPILFNVNSIPVTNISVLAFTFASVYAITNNSLLKSIPKNEWKYIVNNLDEGLLILNSKNVIRFANNKALTIFDLSASNYTSFNLMKSLENLGIPWHAATPNQEDLGFHEGYIQTELDNSKRVKLHLKSFHNDKSNSTELLIIVADLQALRTAEHLATQNSKDLSDFLYRTSHDLKNPSACIEGLLSIYEDATENEKRKCIDLIGVSNNKIKEILLAISSITKVTQQELKPSSFNLPELIKQRVSVVLPSHCNMRVSLNMLEGTTLHTDKTLLTAILDEMISNASQYDAPNI